jgi:hypothetical protein
MHMRVFAFSSLSALALVVVGCGGDSNPTPASVPTALPSIAGTTATPFPFNPGSPGVTIGTDGFVSFTVQNIGSPSMTVSSVTYTGDSAITLQPGVSPTLPATIAFDKYLTVGLTCSPQAAQTYTGTVEIQSNAANLPDIKIVLQCVGVTGNP